MVIAMNCTLSRDDCAEIYHALGTAHATNLQARLGFEGEKLATGKVDLFKRDVEAIYRALVEKRAYILKGAYDTFDGEVNQIGSLTFEMAEQLGRILFEIGEGGEELNRPLRDIA
jgi:hypothetical protein